MEQTKVVQEIVSPEVSELNHFVMNKNKETNDSFLQKKDCRKKKTDSSLMSTHHTS